MSNEKRFVVKHGLQSQNIEFISPDKSKNMSLSILDTGSISFVGNGNVGIGIATPSAKLELAETWNNVATTFTGIKANITDTASSASSTIMDLQVGGVSRYNFRKDGNATFTNGINIGAVSGNLAVAIGISGGPIGVNLQSTAGIGWTSGAQSFGAPDLSLYRDAADTFAQRRGVNAQTSRVYNTFTDASNYERAKIGWNTNVLEIGTENAGTGALRNINLIGGNVGINISSPGTSLDIQGGYGNGLRVRGPVVDNNWYGGIQLTNSTAAATGAAISASVNGIYFAFNGSNHVRISGGGNVSIGGALASSAKLDIAETWNNVATTFTHIKANVTDTASAAGSLLMDLQVGGASKFKVDKAGVIDLYNTGGSITGYPYGASDIRGSGTEGLAFYSYGTPIAGIYGPLGGFHIGRISTSKYTVLTNDNDDNVFSIRKTTSAQTARIYNTYTDASNYERATISWSGNALTIGTEAAGTGSARNIQIVPGSNIVEFGSATTNVVTLQTPNISNYNFKIKPRGTNSLITLESALYQSFEVTDNIINGSISFKLEGTKILVSQKGTTFGKENSSNTVKLFGVDGEFTNDLGKNVEFYTGGASGSNTAIDLKGGNFTFGLGRGHGTGSLPQFTFKTRLGSVRGTDHAEHSVLTLKEQSAIVSGDIKVNSNVSLNSEATTLATVTKTQVASFPSASFRSGKLIVQAYDSVTGEVQISELLVAHNGTTASGTEYGVVFTGTTSIVIYDVDISAGNVRLMATRTTANSTQYKISETLMIA